MKCASMKSARSTHYLAPSMSAYVAALPNSKRYFLWIDSSRLRRRPITRTRANPEFAPPVDAHLEMVIAGRRVLRCEAQHILRVEFSAKPFDCILQCSLARE